MARLIAAGDERPYLRVLLILVVATMAISFAEVAAACPTCKEGVAQNDPQQQSMAAGYYYSILFMMSMPFIIVTTFGSFAYRAVKQAKQAEAQRNASREFADHQRGPSAPR